MKHITILGSTGSIGQNTLDVIARHPQQYRVIALAAHANEHLLWQQCLAFKPAYAVINEAHAYRALQEKISTATWPIQLLCGQAGLEQIATLSEVDTVMASIVGSAGLLATLAAARAGKRILLANKESLIMAGALFLNLAAQGTCEILPVDSEHNALFQCMPQPFRVGHTPEMIKKIILTASGGPFRNTALTQLNDITPAQACAHPVWRMGKKISVDSATLMNKALEIIEAHWLFQLSPQQIEVIIHPQSIIHSMVVYQDGSHLAQLGLPDMRIPISSALAWPERIDNGVNALDFNHLQTLEFAPVDTNRFPALALAYAALARGGTSSVVLNAVNEVMVEAFLQHRIRFTDIVKGIDIVFNRMPTHDATDLDTILHDDALARRLSQETLAQLV